MLTHDLLSSARLAQAYSTLEISELITFFIIITLEALKGLHCGLTPGRLDYTLF